MSIPPYFAVTAVCVLATACAGQSANQTSAPAVVMPPPSPVVPRDGSYDGTMQLVRGDGASCGTQNITTFRVANGAVHYVLNQPQVSWRPQRVFDAVIAPDGSFRVDAGAAYLSGRIDQTGHMQGEVGGDACGFQFQADRSGTW